MMLVVVRVLGWKVLEVEVYGLEVDDDERAGTTMVSDVNLVSFDQADP